MNVTAMPLKSAGPAPQPRPRSEAPQPEQKDVVERSRASFGSVSAGIAGGLAGAVVGGVATASVGGVGRLMGQGVISMLPKGLPANPALAGLLGHTNVIVGVAAGALLLGLGGAALAGTGVAFHAGAGAQKVDPALTSGQKRAQGGFHPLASFQEGGAEMRAQLQDVGGAKSFGQAINAGAQAGASLGGPAGAAAGKVQGAVLGAAIGAIAGLPLASVSPYLAIPTAAFGLFAGARLGEAVGDVTGSVVAGGVGALSATVFHAGQKVFHHNS